MATTTSNRVPSGESKPKVLLFSLVLLAAMYSLLFLSMTERFSHFDLMSRCVLMDPKLSRIWSVANVEVGVAYFGVFAAMTYYLVTIRRAEQRHINDLALAFGYLVGSFLLDWLCVTLFSPFVALLIGDAVVMTFTLLVSRELWFQRLLGVFVPMIFFTCGLGHLLEGLSYWHLTYPMNVPWSMVTADIGFAVLVNTARFPAFIRGSDVQQELDEARELTRQQQLLFRDVLYSVTDGKLCVHMDRVSLPHRLPEQAFVQDLSRSNLRDARETVMQVAEKVGLNAERRDLLLTAAGEGLMNAIVHGREGELHVGADSEQVQVWIEDRGTGISLRDLPSATLQKGWSSRGTMGIGFPLILNTADSVDLATSSAGTVVVITMHKERPLELPFQGGKAL